MKKIFKILIITLLLFTTTQKNFCLTNEEIRNQAKVLYLGNQFKDAQKRISAIPNAEKTAEDYFLIGNTTKDTKAAIKAYESALLLDKTFYPAYYNIGSRYMEIQNYNKAIFYFKEATKQKKDFAAGHYNLGCAYLKTGQYKLARKSFETAIKLNPEEADYYYNLAYIHKKLGYKKRAEKAISLYNTLVEQRNKN